MSHSSNARQFISPGVHLAFSGFPGELKSTAVLIGLPWEFRRSRYNLFLQPLRSLLPPSLPPSARAAPFSAPLSPLAPGPSCALRGDTRCRDTREGRREMEEGRGPGAGREEEGEPRRVEAERRPAAREGRLKVASAGRRLLAAW